MKEICGKSFDDGVWAYVEEYTPGFHEMSDEEKVEVLCSYAELLRKEDFEDAYEKVCRIFSIRYRRDGSLEIPEEDLGEEVWEKAVAYVDGFEDMTDEEQDKILEYWVMRELEVAKELMDDGGMYSLSEFLAGNYDPYDWSRMICEEAVDITDKEAMENGYPNDD